MEKEKDTRKLMRVYIKPETEPDIVEWAENQQNVGIAIKALIRMAISMQGTRDVLALPFGVNALTPIQENQMVTTKSEPKVKEEKAQTKTEPEKPQKPQKEESSSLQSIRSSFYGDTEEASDMDMFDDL